MPPDLTRCNGWIGAGIVDILPELKAALYTSV